MSAVLFPPLPAVWPRPVSELSGRTWTPEELYDLSHPERYGPRRMFLLLGEIWEQGTANAPHDDAIEVLDTVVRAVFGSGFRIRAQLGMRLAEDTEVIPDLLIVATGKQPRGTSHPTTADLIVEVSDTTLFFDTTTKTELYAAASVPQYWVLDVNTRQLIVLREPVSIPAGGHQYRSQQTLGSDDTISPLAAPGQPVRVADLLP